MIRINLLRHISPKRASVRMPVARLVKPLIVVVAVLSVAAAGAYGIRWWRLNRPYKPPPVQVAERKPKTEEKSTAETAAAAQIVPEADYEPSTHIKPKMVEEVVKDIETVEPERPVSGLLELSYNEMSRGEQVNYEYVFTRKVLQILSRSVPEGIGFNTLTIDSFQTVSAVGLAGSREQVTALFNRLRGEKFEMLDPPKSCIRPAGASGYRFSFTCTASFGMDPADPWQFTDHLEPRENLSSLTGKVARLASRDGIFLARDLSIVSSGKSGSYRRFTYRLSGSGTYRNFVRFVLGTHAARVSCAFGNVRLQARNDGMVNIGADIIFTTRE